MEHTEMMVAKVINKRNRTIKEIKAIPATCKVLNTADVLAVVVLWG